MARDGERIVVVSKTVSVTNATTEAASYPQSSAFRERAPMLVLLCSLLGGCGGSPPTRCENGPFDCPAEWAAWPMRTARTPFTVSADTATDPKSGLTWQRMTPKSMQTWRDANDYCEELALGAFDDWRLPSRLELLTLVEYATGTEPPVSTTKPASAFGEPMIDRSTFPDTPPAMFWTASNLVEDDSILTSAWPGDEVAWTVDFRTGLVARQHVDLLLPRTRCVRFQPPPGSNTAGGRFVVNGASVTEKATGLVWERAMFGGTHQAAVQHCAALVLNGKSGFRLPHVKEAMTIASAISDASPCVDPSAFVMPSGFFYGSLFTSTRWNLVENGTVDSGILSVDLSNRGRIEQSDEVGPSGPIQEYALCVAGGNP
jgi:hypothetical protein